MKIGIFFFTYLFHSLSFGHSYHFSFAEVAYNEISQRFESTITVSAHDMETVLKNEDIHIDSLHLYKSDSEKYKGVETYLRDHFSIVIATKEVLFHLVGMENRLNGNTLFYLESDGVTFADEIEVNFDLLMEHYEQQQNKITFYYREQFYTATFVRNQRIQKIRIENT